MWERLYAATVCEPKKSRRKAAPTSRTSNPRRDRGFRAFHRFRDVRRVLGFAAFVVEAHRNRLRNTTLFHRHAVDRAGRRDGALVVRDDDELRLIHEFL